MRTMRRKSPNLELIERKKVDRFWRKCQRMVKEGNGYVPGYIFYDNAVEAASCQQELARLYSVAKYFYEMINARPSTKMDERLGGGYYTDPKGFYLGYEEDEIFD